MNDKMSISVVIPLYNSRNTIIDTLVSVKNQTLMPFEIIIVDDGSTDGSAILVEEFIANNAELNISIVKKTNGGVSSARNLGMKLARGNWIALLDSDDKWLSNKLKRQIEILDKNPHIDLLATNRNEECFKRFLFKKFENLTSLTPRLLLYKNFISPPTVIFKRTLLETVGFFDENLRYAEEGNYWLRICNVNNCFLLNESLVLTGSGKPNFGYSGLSSNLVEMEKGELKNIKTALTLRIIGLSEFIFLNIFSIVKYLRRVMIVKIRNKYA